MMNGMTPAMTWGMGAVCALVIVILILAAAALVKYLRSGTRHGGNEEVSSGQSVDLVPADDGSAGGPRGRHA